jgi:hypothetical protein
MSAVTLEMIEQMQLQTILAASEAVHRTYAKCSSARMEIDRIERERKEAVKKHETAVAERGAAIAKVREFVVEYAGLAAQYADEFPTTTTPTPTDDEQGARA